MVPVPLSTWLSLTAKTASLQSHYAFGIDGEWRCFTHLLYEMLFFLEVIRVRDH